ncbi:hypothetical protein PAXRUDRAFT_160032, partial [Paxillus rubicundulus Ve08.2h10]
FDQCIGAVDGTHICISSSLGEHGIMCNCKGFLSHNCLFICNINFWFTYALCGWDGSMADAALWHDACEHDLHIPEGRYLLADASFGTCDALLVSYWGVHYHLKEWQQSVNFRPWNAEELFNLHHAALCNVVKCIFGILKQQWRILQVAPEYNMTVQAQIPAALCALHNFIQQYNPDKFDVEYDGDLLENDDDVAWGQLAEGPASPAERRHADNHHDQIAQEMWVDYLRELTVRGLQLP